MKRRLLSVTALFLVLTLGLAGCGKAGSDKDLDGTVSAISDTKTEKENTPNESNNNETSTSLSESVTQTEPENHSVMDIWEEFLDYKSKCLVNETEMMDLNEVFHYYCENEKAMENESFYISTAGYAFIDCGGDGVEELVVNLRLDAPEDSWGFGPVDDYIFFRYDGEKIVLFAEAQSYYRTGFTVFDNGLTAYGGSNGAASYGYTYSVLTGDGDLVFAFEISDTYTEGRPFISYFEIAESLRPEDYPMFDWQADQLFPNDVTGTDYLMRSLFTVDRATIIEEAGMEAYETSLLNTQYFAADENGDVVEIPESYLEYYRSIGIELRSISEFDAIIERRMFDLGFDSSILEGQAVDWTYISMG